MELTQCAELHRGNGIEWEVWMHFFQHWADARIARFQSKLAAEGRNGPSLLGGILSGRILSSAGGTGSRQRTCNGLHKGRPAPRPADPQSF